MLQTTSPASGERHLRRAEVAVAEMVGGGHHHRGSERDDADCDLSPPRAVEMRPLEGSEDGKNREGGKQQTVDRAVEDPTPEHCSDKSGPGRTCCRGLTQDDEREDRSSEQTEDDGETPMPVQHLVQGLIGRSCPGEEEPEHQDTVEAVVNVLRQVQPIGEDERDKKSTHKCAKKPGKLLASSGRKAGEAKPTRGSITCVLMRITSFRTLAQATVRPPEAQAFTTLTAGCGAGRQRPVVMRSGESER